MQQYWAHGTLNKGPSSCSPLLLHKVLFMKQYEQFLWLIHNIPDHLQSKGTCSHLLYQIYNHMAYFKMYDCRSAAACTHVCACWELCQTPNLSQGWGGVWWDEWGWQVCGARLVGPWVACLGVGGQGAKNSLVRVGVRKNWAFLGLDCFPNLYRC